MSEDEDASISRAVFQVFRRTAADGGNRDRERPLRMMAQVLTGEEIDQAILRKRGMQTKLRDSFWTQDLFN